MSNRHPMAGASPTIPVQNSPNFPLDIEASELMEGRGSLPVVGGVVPGPTPALPFLVVDGAGEKVELVSVRHPADNGHRFWGSQRATAALPPNFVPLFLFVRARIWRWSRPRPLPPSR